MASSKVFVITIIFAVLFLVPSEISARQLAEPFSTKKTHVVMRAGNPVVYYPNPPVQTVPGYPAIPCQGCN